jgi:hypothetical protein
MPPYICGPGVSCDLIESTNHYLPTNLGSYISRVIAWVRHMGLDQYIDLLALKFRTEEDIVESRFLVNFKIRFLWPIEGGQLLAQGSRPLNKIRRPTMRA